MTDSSAVAGFLPSVHGLHFVNRFAPGPTVRLGILDPRRIGFGDAAAGLCGGMCEFVAARFEAALPVPAASVEPPNDSLLFRLLVRHQVRSLDWLRGPLRFWWMGMRGPRWAKRRTVDVELPRIVARIDAGRLVRVGLVRHTGWNPKASTTSHQVLAFAYARRPEPGSATLRLYDPNWPDRDDITLSVSPTGLHQSTGEPLLGLLALS